MLAGALRRPYQHVFLLAERQFESSVRQQVHVFYPATVVNYRLIVEAYGATLHVATCLAI